jgi:hypothetical protein
MIALSATNLSIAWLEALERLLGSGGEAVNLVVAIQSPGEENPRVRSRLDDFIARVEPLNRERKVETVVTVANTIFPEALYLPRLEERARGHLYEMHGLAYRVSKRRNPYGTYFSRLVDWPGPQGGVNQLEQAVVRLAGARERGQRRGNAYEMQFSDTIADENGLSLPIYKAGVDNRVMGFPCLSHVSLTLNDGKVHLTALYRNHEWIRRAYGNYLGLSRLLSFVANESGWQVGELVCVSSHAIAEISQGAGFGKADIEVLAKECRAALAKPHAGAGSRRS